VGLVVVAVGVVLVFISAAADVIGLGSAARFGNRQIIGSVLGAVAVAAGLVVAFLPTRPAGRHPKPADRPTQPIKHRRKR
jgi:hypothetical protein